MIFIDDDNRAMYDLHHDIRFINLSEFPVSSACEFIGFICGLISNNYDIEKIYIDGILTGTLISALGIGKASKLSPTFLTLTAAPEVFL